jgi:hypothetical protein
MTLARFVPLEPAHLRAIKPREADAANAACLSDETLVTAISQAGLGYALVDGKTVLAVGGAVALPEAPTTGLMWSVVGKAMRPRHWAMSSNEVRLWLRGLFAAGTFKQIVAETGGSEQEKLWLLRHGFHEHGSIEIAGKDHPLFVAEGR